MNYNAPLDDHNQQIETGQVILRSGKALTEAAEEAGYTFGFYDQNGARIPQERRPGGLGEAIVVADVIYDQDKVKERTGITGHTYLGKVTVPTRAKSGETDYTSFHIFRAGVDFVDGRKAPHNSDLVWSYDNAPVVKGYMNRQPVPYSVTFIPDGSLRSLIAMNGHDPDAWDTEQNAAEMPTVSTEIAQPPVVAETANTEPVRRSRIGGIVASLLSLRRHQREHRGVENLAVMEELSGLSNEIDEQIKRDRLDGEIVVIEPGGGRGWGRGSQDVGYTEGTEWSPPRVISASYLPGQRSLFHVYIEGNEPNSGVEIRNLSDYYLSVELAGH